MDWTGAVEMYFKTDESLIATQRAFSVHFMLQHLFWFYGISNIGGDLMPNPIFTYIYIKYMICELILLIHTLK